MGAKSKIVQVIIYLFMLTLYTTISLLFTFKYGNSQSGPEAGRDVSPEHLTKGMLVVSWKTYVKSAKCYYTDKACNVNVEIYKLSDRETIEISSRNGKFENCLELEARYLIYISKAGYETKVIAFSTYGVLQGDCYAFSFDVLLKKGRSAGGDLAAPLFYVTYNSSKDIFVYQRYSKHHAA